MERTPGVYRNKRDAARGIAWACLGIIGLTAALMASAVAAVAIVAGITWAILGC